jgi:hypothetical protein
MQADTDHVPLLEAVGVEWLKRFVAQDGIAPLRRRGCGENEHPAGGDKRRPEGEMAWIYDMYAHGTFPSSVREIMLIKAHVVGADPHSALMLIPTGSYHLSRGRAVPVWLVDGVATDRQRLTMT